VTLSTAAIAIAASTAVPPRFNTSRPTWEASGWLVATMPWLARTTDRPAGTPENHWALFTRSAADWGAAASTGRDMPVIARVPAATFRNSRLSMAALYTTFR